MKSLLIITFLFSCTAAFSQHDPATLARQLTSSSKTELGKVTSIFKWVTNNISYRVKPNNPIIGTASLKNFQNEMAVDSSPIKPLSETVAEAVLEKRVAVCEGYARLFTTLCDYAGIRSEIIIGYAGSNNNKPQRFGVNHYWNAVMIDSNWYLLDATWASGYVSWRGDEFVRQYDEKYFLSSPEVFIQDHYPDDARWTLLQNSKVPEEFRYSPFRQKSFAKYRITSFYPGRGVIETYVGDTIRLQLETSLSEYGRNVSPDMLVDSAIYSYSSSWVFLKPESDESSISLNRHNYIYTIVSPEVEWLYLLYNDDVVLRYKVNVKKKKS